MDWRMDDWSLSSRVSPFRNLRLIGYLLLPAAFRSLSRLSSALSAKASALRPFLLDLLSWHIALCHSVLVLLRYLLKMSSLNKNLFIVRYAVFKVHVVTGWLLCLAVWTATAQKNLFFCPVVVQTILIIFLGNPAATCSPTPSPVQYHRPLRS